MNALGTNHPLTADGAAMVNCSSIVAIGNPDAELVAAWRAFCDAWRRQLALAKTNPEDSRKAQADLIQLMRLIQSTPVATIDGILVKVRLLAHFKVIELRSPFVLDDPTQPIYGRIYGSLESTSSRLILDLVRDLHALTVRVPELSTTLPVYGARP